MPHEPCFYFSLRHNQWVLYSDISYTHKGIRILVKKGFVTDIASVPFFVRPIINNAGRYNFAATIHDYLYSVRGVLPCGSVFTRKQCDDVFYDIMVGDGVSRLVAGVMWFAVRVWFINSFRF